MKLRNEGLSQKSEDRTEREREAKQLWQAKGTLQMQ